MLCSDSSASWYGDPQMKFIWQNLSGSLAGAICKWPGMSVQVYLNRSYPGDYCDPQYEWQNRRKTATDTTMHRDAGAAWYWHQLDLGRGYDPGTYLLAAHRSGEISHIQW